MTSILRFRTPPRAELWGGIVSRGPRAGQPVYFIDYIDEEGAALGIWNGVSYDAACEVLKEWRQDGVHTVDRLREAR